LSLTVRSSTTTSFLALAASKIWLKARSICPVSTNVPEIMATPRGNLAHPAGSLAGGHHYS